MYSTKFVIILCVIGFVKANDDFRQIDNIYQEPLCSAQGGLCTIASDCPTGHLVEETGLCPHQQRIGVDCCYGLSVKETRCSRRGGTCLPGKNPCSHIVWYKEATDCPNDTKCCILVQKK